MATMEAAFGVPVGYSDHSTGNDVSLAAVALGACIIEKHFTLDRSLPGPDHQASAEPADFAAMVAAIRTVEAALGDGDKRPAASELDGRFLGLTAGLACLLGSNRITAAVRAGRDMAHRDRPGGDQRQLDLRLAWLGAIGGGTLLADLVLSHQRDQEGYSPLLENNAVRRLKRASLRLEYAYPVAAGWSVLVTADGTLQRSNLELFDIAGRAVYLALRWQTFR